jgi:actin-related protein 10
LLSRITDANAQVYHSRPLFNVLHTTPRAGSRLHARLVPLLEKFGRFLPPGALAPNSSPSPAVAAPIPREHLTYSFVEDLKTRILFVSTPIAAQGQPMDLDLPEETSEPNTPYDESKDVRWLTQIQTTYSAELTATDLSVRLPDGKGTVIVPGWVRERAAELFFEPGDEDEASLTETILELLLKVRGCAFFQPV